jgi:hypothetical protein
VVNEIIKIMSIKAQIHNSLTCMLKFFNMHVKEKKI